MDNEELREYIKAKRKPISHCTDLTKYFIGRHVILPVYLTPTFEQEFNSSMCTLEELRKENKDLKEKNEFLMKRDNRCQVLEQVISNIKSFIEELYDNTDDTTCYDIDINTKQDILDILKEVEQSEKNNN